LGFLICFFLSFMSQESLRRKCADVIPESLNGGPPGHSSLICPDYDYVLRFVPGTGTERE
jgi:hypothetical protein